MVAEKILKNLMSLSKPILEKIRSFLKVQPTRPNSAAKIVASIMNPGDHYPEGFVFALPDGRLFYAATEEEMLMDRIEELHNPHPDITNVPKGSTGLDNEQPFSKLGLGSKATPVKDPEVIKLLVKAYYGTKAPKKLRELSLA